MPTWIGLLRRVNVGGNNKMPMADLTVLLESIGCTNVRTYIQSGNVVFASPLKTRATLSRKVMDAIEKSFGFRAHVLLLSPAQFFSAIEQNPFADAVSDPKSLHFFFLDAPPAKPDIEGIENLAARTERFRLVGELFYLHAPEGIGRSKLAAAAEKKLGVAATARNYNTIEALAAMVAED